VSRVFEARGTEAPEEISADGVRVGPTPGSRGSGADQPFQRSDEHDLAGLALAAAPIATAVLDAEGCVCCANRAFAALTGRSARDLLGVPLAALVVPAHRLLVRSSLSAAAPTDASASNANNTAGSNTADSNTAGSNSRGAHPAAEPPVLRVAPSSADRWAQLHVARLPGEGLRPSTAEAVFVVQLVDVTEQRLQERRLHDLAFRDPLTQVLSRRGIERAITTFCERADRGGPAAVLLAIDLDRFKDVNDTFGHPVGDTVLARMAAEMRRRLRPKDLVGRLGGDEFVVLLPSCRLADAGRIADDLLAAVAGGLERLSLDAPGADLDDSRDPRGVTASVGIAPFERGHGPDAVIAAADRALYAAKRRGGNCWSFDPGPSPGPEHGERGGGADADDLPACLLVSPRP
jgi:diguanylate cyclase (GGDEF)-like protein